MKIRAAAVGATIGDYPIDLDDINAMSADAFIAAFGDIAEHAPWVAADAEEERPFASRDAMIAAFATAVADGDPERQVTLLRGHPELAARESLTDDSAIEQRSAGLDRLSRADYQRLAGLNAAYRTRFGFPFIMAVRGASKDDILASLEGRLKNPPAAEFARALVEVQRIVRLRLEARVSS